MKLNIFFLIIGLFLSIISKVLQFKIKSYAYIGNIIVIPAAICFCLAILFSIKKYYYMFFAQETRLKAIIIAVLACGIIVSFQLMMILIFSGKEIYGLIFLVPLLLLIFLFIRNWFIK
ncbi:hypothetical protein HMPREF1982_01987 [Clostridiales bacterium oral taxon 876 str. F0540]|nr:hypothetical protein HMPREF1982_01987 [Clostridiales bacterium oral taxon 876 str. F0540]